VRSIDAHGIELLNVHDVEVTASVHQHLSESLSANDPVHHEQVSAWMQDALWVVGSVEGDGGSRGRGRLGHVELKARELLAALRVISHRSTEDHEAAGCFQKGVLLPFSIILRWVRLLLLIPPLGAPRQESLHEGAVLVQVLDGVGVVRAWPFE
jgi:hypothetical protein